MEDKERYDCPYCKSGKWYPHRMDFSKVKLLQQIAEINKRYNWVKIQQDSNLIKEAEKEYTIQTDAVHATRLVWFRLLDKKDNRSGFVKINQRGIEFLKGKLKIPSRIWVSKGELKEEEITLVSVYEIKGVILDKNYWDHYPSIENWKEVFR